MLITTIVLGDPSGHGSLQSLGFPEVVGPTMQVVLRTKKQAGHQGGPLPTQSISSVFLHSGAPRPRLCLSLLSVTNRIMQSVQKSEK